MFWLIAAFMAFAGIARAANYSNVSLTRLTSYKLAESLGHDSQSGGPEQLALSRYSGLD